MEIRSWEETLNSAKEFVDFIDQKVLFNKPFNNTMGAFVTTDVKHAFKRSWEEDSSFPNWPEMSRGETTFPKHFEFPSYIQQGLDGVEYFGVEFKNFSGVDAHWEYTLHDLIMSDIDYIFYCYANGYFPPIWEKILQAYLNGGLPCGWSDFPPKGQLVVFSNEMSR